MRCEVGLQCLRCKVSSVKPLVRCGIETKLPDPSSRGPLEQKTVLVVEVLHPFVDVLQVVLLPNDDLRVGVEDSSIGVQNAVCKESKGL